MYKDERDIFYYDIKSSVWNRKYPAGLAPFAHFELAKVAKKLFKADKAEFTQKGLQQSTYVTGIRVFADRCEILIGFSDPNAADPTLNDRPARKRRVVNKTGGEGLEHSAHIIWHYKTKTNSDPCAFYLEGAVGLSSAAVVRFLNRLLRLYAQDHADYFSVPDPEGSVDADGNFKRIPTRPKVELLGHPSAEFIRDLKAGELSELELYTEAAKTKPWDANAYVVEEHRSVLVKPNPLKHGPRAKAMVDAVLSMAVKNDYELARVKFKTVGDVPRNIRFYSQNYQLINDNTYVKKAKIKELGGNLPNAFEKFHGAIVRAMRGLAKIP